MKPLPTADPAPKRSCGGCTACCTTIGVAELGKAPGERCPKLGARGCSIYAERPAECREFNCAWLYGVGDFSDRPDKSGVVVVGAGADKLVFFEVDAGAAGLGGARMLAHARSCGVVVSIVGPPEVKKT